MHLRKHTKNKKSAHNIMLTNPGGLSHALFLCFLYLATLLLDLTSAVFVAFIVAVESKTTRFGSTRWTSNFTWILMWHCMTSTLKRMTTRQSTNSWCFYWNFTTIKSVA